MKILEYNNIRRSEEDQGVIDNLIRKGWIDVSPPEKPEPPEYNSEIERLEYNEETNSYSKIQYTENELAQLNRAKQHEIILQSISSGYSVQPEGFILGLTESDRNAFTQMLALTKEALDFGLITNDTPQTIADKSGQKHQITTLRFRQIMVAYGFYYKTLWDQLS